MELFEKNNKLNELLDKEYAIISNYIENFVGPYKDDIELKIIDEDNCPIVTGNCKIVRKDNSIINAFFDYDIDRYGWDEGRYMIIELSNRTTIFHVPSFPIKAKANILTDGAESISLGKHYIDVHSATIKRIIKDYFIKENRKEA